VACGAPLSEPLLQCARCKKASFCLKRRLWNNTDDEDHEYDDGAVGPGTMPMTMMMTTLPTLKL